MGYRVFHQIAAAIVDEELAPGLRVRDVTLGERYHVSRSPVREALHRLERVGLVEILPSRVTRVTLVTDDVVAETVVYAGYQAGLAARQGAAFMTTAERTQALGLIDAVRASLSDRVASSAHRRALFGFLAAQGDNRLHRAHMRDMEYAFERNLRQADLPSGPEAERSLDALQAAILRSDPVEAERWARAMHGVVPPG